MKLGSRFRSAFFCCSLLLLSYAPAWTQEGFRSLDTSVAGDAGEIGDLLSEGIQLERQRRWGEALSHYESATRRHPGNPQLQSRMGLTRIHFDLTRRYTDQSYLASVRKMPSADATELLNEVLLKIQTHYVHEPNWDELLLQGTRGLEVALSDKDFLKTHRLSATHEESTSLVQHISQSLSQRTVQDRKQAQEMVRWAASVAERQLGVPTNAVILEYMCAMASSLDAYSTYLTGDQLDEVFSQIEGNFVGLGIELKAEQETLLIANVIPQGPAHRAGIRAQERIVAVDGRLTREVSTDVAADLLKGEEGTFVDVTLESPDGTSRVLRVRRERVEVPSVEEVSMVDPQQGIAYFRISSFQKTTSRDVDAALWKLHREGMRSLIVDVRGNPGGLLNEAVEVADRFIQDGTIVATHGRSARENYDYKAHRVGTWRMPLVVLIDGDSASASEIFAGAIHDHRRGTVVGDRSYGKGSVQGIFPLRAVKAGVRLTTAKFYSPSGKAISQGGVTPDVVVRSAAKPATTPDEEVASVADEDPSRDRVLQAGIQVAKQLIAERAGQDSGAREAQRHSTDERGPRSSSNARLPGSR